ncbi:hypothetical protein [Nocardia jejuensis]|uniref:hypothetical protein n=1 Tax=Nocardia jejuensis TaxID=328049 RepID=UPI0012FB3108|nr:hypothetical protein [Nocardia jejuensis]
MGVSVVPVLFAPSASASINDIIVGVPGVEIPRACDTAGRTCHVMVRMFGADYELPVTVTVNGKPLSLERTDYPNYGTAALQGDWRPPAKGTYTFVATQGTSTKSLAVTVTEGLDTGSLSGLLPSGSGS